MTTSLLIFGALGVATTVYAFVANRRLFQDGAAGRTSTLEVVYYVLGLASLLIGWYCNVRYVHATGGHATYWSYTKALFSNWASDSAAQDYTMVNLVLLPLWTIVDGRRRGMRSPWIFYVMSFFTSLAFAMAWYLAFVERQLRYNRAEESSRTAVPQL